MKASILVLSSIFFAPVAFSQPDESLTPAEKIKILSWNIYMLPGFLGQGKVPRAEAIGDLLASSDYDVIVFQEAFHQKARKKIRRLLQSAYPFQVGPANQKRFSLKTNSGLWIFSRHPILEARSIIFNTRSGIDAMSRKGALLVELNIHGKPIQVIGTHLQNSGQEWRRQAQCVELYHLLLKKYERFGVPQIICGDFNINRLDHGDDYRLMLQTLDASDGELTAENSFTYDRLSNDLQVEPGEDRDLIDYILVRPNEANISTAERRIRSFRHQWSNHHQDLSDHYSLETELHFTGSMIALSEATQN